MAAFLAHLSLQIFKYWWYILAVGSKRKLIWIDQKLKT